MRIFASEQDDLNPWNKTVDFTSIEFPSDRLAIKVLRQIHPDLFDIGFAGGQLADDQPQYFFIDDANNRHIDYLGEMLHQERVIAAGAYAKAAGLSMPERRPDAYNAKEELPKAYVYFRIANGLNEANELIRGIERQARELASSVKR